MRLKKLFALGMTVASLSLSMAATANAATVYEFNSSAPGQTFYQSTSVDSMAMGNSDQLVIGMDGTIATNATGLVSLSPLSILNVPIGMYPEAWGSNTDMAIAMNTLIPNELGPTANNTNFYKPMYTPVVFTAGLAPYYNYAPSK